MCRSRLEMPSVCRGCANRLSARNEGVDIFGQGESSSLRKDNNIRTGIELITGLAVSDTDGLPGRLCAECNGKLEGFLAFRNQLLTSLKGFLGSGQNSGKSEPLPEEASCKVEPESAAGLDNKYESIDREGKYAEELSKAAAAGCNDRTGPNKANVVDEEAESDIDVCSGEDYDVLELDVQSRKDEIYEIESSGESDIQVCDYEPNGL